MNRDFTAMDRAAEERRWNRLSATMEQFHEHFRYTFDELYDTADRKRLGPSLQSFLSEGLTFIHYLTMHHTIEERHIFPILQRKMPSFGTDAKHLASHKAIHSGLDRLEALLDKYVAEPAAYSPAELRKCLDSFREVLFTHLDEEVQDLRGENLRKYFTYEEMLRLPM